MASPRTPPSPRASFPIVLAGLAPLLAGALFHAVFIARASFRVEGQLTFSLFDDAMISLTYARNLAEGHGLVWMPGERPVEGYTNFLWTLLLAIPHAAGLPDRLAALPVLVFGAALLFATSALAAALARRLARHPATPALAAAASAFCYPLVFWTLRGLEVGLLAALVLAACLLALRLLERPSGRERALLCLVLAAAILTRTDAAFFVGVVLVFLALHAGGPRRDALAGALATLATFAAHTAFRVAYYGAALPNTYHLKLGGHTLVERVTRGGGALFDLLAGTLWAPTALALALLLLRRASLGQGERLLLGIVASALAYSVWVGGDVWEFAGFANRFVSVALPALFLLALLGGEALLQRLGARGAPLPAWAVLAAGLLVIGAANARPFEGFIRRGGLHVQDDEIMVRTALALRAASPPGTRVAVVWAGAIPYFSRLPAIDLFGKSDPVIAHLAPRGPFVPGHDKWDFAYSIGRRRPEVVVLAWKIGPEDRELLARLGYERVAQYYVQREADVDRRRLRAPWR